MAKTNTGELLKRATTIYFVGIKGVGMTALAQILLARGKNIRGSDTTETFFTERVLAAENIRVDEGFSKQHIDTTIDLVVRSDAYGETHEEVARAREIGIPVLRYQEVLNVLSATMPTIAIAGSHGKTTTTALTGVLHECVGNDPTVLVGSEVPAFHGSARTGNGNLFITEADEYNKKLLELAPSTLVITNIDYDHPDTYPTPKDYRDVFAKAIAALPRNATLIVNADDAETNTLERTTFPDQTITFGVRNENATFHAVNRTLLPDGTQSFSVVIGGNMEIGPFTTTLAGEHNIANILAALATLSMEELRANGDSLVRAIASFSGTTRRMEHIGKTKHGAIVIDDYAHHPTEIRATLKALKERYPKRHVWCVFHPHTFSRTAALFEEFAASFADADVVSVLDIYASAREEKGTVTSEALVRKLRENGVDAEYIHDPNSLQMRIADKADDHDVIITMGAGDVWKIAHDLVHTSREKTSERTDRHSHPLEEQCEVMCAPSKQKEHLPTWVERDVDIRHLSTFKTGGKAAFLVKAETRERLKEALVFARTKMYPVVILGGGSNILFPDETYEGMVIVCRLHELIVDRKTGGVWAEAGVPLARLVHETIRAGLQGFEWAAGVPGSVGGAIRGNAGCFGGETRDHLIEVETLSVDDEGNAIERCIPAERTAMRYRSSIFKDDPSLVILAGRWQLARGNGDALQKMYQANLERKRATQPIGKPCAGSFFKNIDVNSLSTRARENVKNNEAHAKNGVLPTSLLIDRELHMKGHIVGGAQVSNTHAGYIVNTKNATAADILTLAAEIEQRMMEKLDIRLEREVHVVNNAEKGEKAEN